MKTTPTPTGWTETSEVKFDVVIIKMQFQKIQEWIEFHEKDPKMQSANRMSCGRCKTKWTDFKDKSQFLALAQIRGQVNRPICKQCASEITGAAKI